MYRNSKFCGHAGVLLVVDCSKLQTELPIVSYDALYRGEEDPG